MNNKLSLVVPAAPKTNKNKVQLIEIANRWPEKQEERKGVVVSARNQTTQPKDCPKTNWMKANDLQNKNFFKKKDHSLSRSRTQSVNKRDNHKPSISPESRAYQSYFKPPPSDRPKTNQTKTDLGKLKSRLALLTFKKEETRHLVSKPKSIEPTRKRVLSLVKPNKTGRNYEIGRNSEANFGEIELKKESFRENGTQCQKSGNQSRRKEGEKSGMTKSEIFRNYLIAITQTNGKIETIDKVTHTENSIGSQSKEREEKFKRKNPKLKPNETQKARIVTTNSEPNEEKVRRISNCKRKNDKTSFTGVPTPKSNQNLQIELVNRNRVKSMNIKEEMAKKEREKLGKIKEKKQNLSGVK